MEISRWLVVLLGAGCVSWLLGIFIGGLASPKDAWSPWKCLRVGFISFTMFCGLLMLVGCQH
jgi:hypothetical protein